MAKIQILAVLIILISTGFAKSSGGLSPGLEFTPYDLEGFITNFLESAQISLVSKSTIPCKDSFHQEILDGADAINELLNYDTWNGMISVAEVLGGSAYVARNCTYSVDELSAQFYNYLQAFPTFESWIVQIKDNVSRNMLSLSLLTVQLTDEWKKENRDYPNLGRLLGEIVYYTVERPEYQRTLRYLRQDPIAPAPMNQYVWTTFEALFELLKNSQILTEDQLVK